MIQPENCRDGRGARWSGCDRELVTLIGKRMRFMDSAARIKGEVGQGRDETRKAEVIANERLVKILREIRRNAVLKGTCCVVEASIAHELQQFALLSRTGWASAHLPLQL